MTLLYTHPLFLEHRTGQHPECPERLTSISRQLQQAGLDRQCALPEWTAATIEQLSRVHRRDYISAVKRFSAGGGGQIEADTVCSPQSFDAATFAVGAACDAVRRVVHGEDRTALCLVRPPGHHALAAAPMGFCLFGNAAVAAKTAVEELGLDRVLVVDWDVHHGNGTQAIFWEDPRVGFYSIHRWPFYPGTGDADETGSGAGLGTTLNVPLRFGISRPDYLDRFRAGLEKFADQMRPQLILISAGFDSHREDPIGSLGLETEDFAVLTGMVLDVAAAHAGGRVVSVLEGGYNTTALAASVEVHLRKLLTYEPASRTDGSI